MLNFVPGVGVQREQRYVFDLGQNCGSKCMAFYDQHACACTEESRGWGFEQHVTSQESEKRDKTKNLTAARLV